MKSALFEADGRDIKVRAISDQIYLTGIEKSDFVDVVLKKLSGNTSAQKQSLAQSVLDELQLLGLQGCSLTVEVLEIDRASYANLVT